MNLKRKGYLISRLKVTLKKIMYFGNRYYCNVCNSRLRLFLPGGINAEAIIKHEIIGAGFHELDTCPVCLASYRQRFQKLYFDQIKDKVKHSRILHIAPEPSLNYLFNKLSIDYTSGDIEPERYIQYPAPIKLDVTKLCFDSDTFDIIVCNHVLEHVPDDKKAMKELYRVLKPDGYAFLQVPISIKLDTTYENESVTSDEDRLKEFGQKDHVRIYAMDYVERLKEAGFNVEVLRIEHLETPKNLKKLELDLKEQLFVCRK